MMQLLQLCITGIPVHWLDYSVYFYEYQEGEFKCVSILHSTACFKILKIESVKELNSQAKILCGKKKNHRLGSEGKRIKLILFTY